MESLKTYPSHLAICLLVTSTSITSCRREPILEKLRESQAINNLVESRFTAAFHDPMPPFEKAPNIGNIGELLTRSPVYLISNFPQSEVSKLQPVMRPVLEARNLDSLTISYFENDPERPEQTSVVNGMGRITFNRDGSTTQSKGEKIENTFPKPTLEGRSILVKKIRRGGKMR